MSANASKRTYRKRQRAEQEAVTRRRITEAAVRLHGSVGPARTTVSAIAAEAGVERATVYRHFPDEEQLFEACSTHWASLNPPPDVQAWGEIADPDERLRRGLEELYAWFEQGEEMLVLVNRDATLVPAMRRPVQRTAERFAAMVELLARGRPERGAARRRVRGALGHVVSFGTWHSLRRQQGLSHEETVALARGLVAGAARATARRAGPRP